MFIYNSRRILKSFLNREYFLNDIYLNENILKKEIQIEHIIR